ncbi:LysM peptidoglycan-binding domain-containing protein [Ammoniphilus sp. CFH 90114]|uniref:LysM peptidoglycan-binding domain-containing protein n=1 Tax=Ammoniphilus sp. CFH 90114 TaxID=2493665 RepID=UPI0013E971BD|nr:LysM peptidoglycan-binding domain-containing protein [Ammoniphilus sp. CFH 90114]
MTRQRWKRWVGQGMLATLLLSSTQAAYAQNYTVQRGDSLFLISQQYGITVDQLKTANRLTSDEIWIGHTLTIPPKSFTYTVQAGDTLFLLAQRYKTTIEQLTTLNQLNSSNLLIGQKIQIPEGSTPIVTAPTLDSSTYLVKPGDMLWKIAQSTNTTVEAIKQVNKLSNDYIEVGQTLKIPDPGSQAVQPTPLPSPVDKQVPWVEYQTHTVQSGETGWTISLKYGIPFSEFLQLNNMTEKSMLSIGQKVKVAIHHVPVKPVSSPQSGELLDWSTEAQYVFPIGATARVVDIATGQTWNIKRTIGAFHADCEPLTSRDAEIMKAVWGGNYSWSVRPVLLEVNGRRLAASMSSMPHDIQYITDNNFAGHADVHFLNSLRHKDAQVDPRHQEAVRLAAGIK